MLDELRVNRVRERLLMIKAMPSMAGLDEEACAILASHTLERVFEPGEVLLRENEPIRAGFLVVDGLVEVRRDGCVTASIDRGGVGFLSILAQDPRGVEAIALKRSRTLELPVEALFNAYEENFSFLRNALRLISTSILAKRDGLPRREDEVGEVQTGEWFDRPQTMVERLIKITQRMSILTSVNLDAAIDWVRCAQEVRVDPGHVFWRSGDASASTLFIEYGRIRCSTRDGRSTMVGYQYGLGTLDPLCNRTRSYDAVADTKVIGLKMERDDWMSVIENHRRLGTNLARVLAIRLLHLQLEDARRSVGARAV